MFDRDFLIWLYDRLIYVHNEDANVDYMRKLASIINAYSPMIITPNTSDKPILEIGNGIGPNTKSKVRAKLHKTLLYISMALNASLLAFLIGDCINTIIK